MKPVGNGYEKLEIYLKPANTEKRVYLPLPVKQQAKLVPHLNYLNGYQIVSISSRNKSLAVFFTLGVCGLSALQMANLNDCKKNEEILWIQT